MNQPDPDLLPFEGTRDDFIAYLHELEPAERSAFIATLPEHPRGIADRLFPGPPEAPTAPVSVPMPMPPDGWRFRVRNVGRSPEAVQVIYLRNSSDVMEHARAHVIERAALIWRSNGIPCTNATATLVDESGKALQGFDLWRAAS